MDLSRYAELFLTESREHLSAINHSLLELERTSGDAESVGAIFRAVHTVKGMSATMGYRAVAELSHELETLLDRVRCGECGVTPELMDALFAAADVLERAIELSVAGRDGEVDVAPVTLRLRALGGAEGGGAPGHGASDPARAGTTVPGRAHAASSAPTHAAEGLLVRIRLHEGTPLRGVRAFLIVQKASTLGRVTTVEPAVEALQSEEFDREFSLRIVTGASPAVLERALRAVGDVEQLEVGERERDDAGGPPQEHDVTAAAAPSHPADAAGIATPPEGAPALPGTGEPGELRQQRHVRIDLRRLDALMNLIGELVITRGRLAVIARGLGDAALDEAVAQATRLISDLQDEIMTSRMVPVWQVFDRFPRLVRDAARALGKQVEFAIVGKEIELDRSMLDEIGDPIVHLLRNAIDHGIESPEQRVASAKLPVGRLTLSASRDRTAVVIRVSDDGKGIDRGRVLQKARALGLVESGKTELSDEELIRLVSRPGFSTAEKVTDISGRGVGIDAVQNRVRGLGGSVDIRSTPGEGTSVTVRLPLTLAIVRALLAKVQDEVYALPLTHVNETVELSANALRTVKGREVLVLRDDVLPLMRMRDLVRLPAGPAEHRQQVIVLAMGERRAGLIVDELTGQQEIVVKQFDGVRDGLSLFSGATILGDGAPALIVDVSSLL